MRLFHTEQLCCPAQILVHCLPCSGLPVVQPVLKYINPSSLAQKPIQQDFWQPYALHLACFKLPNRKAFSKPLRAQIQHVAYSQPRASAHLTGQPDKS